MSNHDGRENELAKREFFKHLIVYLIVNTFLIIINLSMAPDFIWFIWPLLGWGLGVCLHAVKVFVRNN
jgi:hypothetical protein